MRALATATRPRRPGRAAVPPARVTPRVQPQLRIGPVDDPLEREADRVADTITAGGFAAPPPADDEDTIVRRACGPDCAAHAGEDDALRRKPARDAGVAPAGSAARAAAAVANGGTPLPAPSRAYFEPRFGRDLSDVRVHTGGAAAGAADLLGARAFTLGNRIAFAPGEYAPATDAGRRLLAHELAHVAQQSGGVIRRQPKGAHDSPPRRRARVDLIEISCGSMAIVFRSADGEHRYPLTECDVSDGEYDAGIGRSGGHITFNLGTAAPQGRRFFFSWSPPRPGETTPAQLLAGQESVHIWAHQAGIEGEEAAPAADAGPAWRFSARAITGAELQNGYGVDPQSIPAGTIVPLDRAGHAAIAPALTLGPQFFATPMSMVPANATGFVWTQGHLSLFATPGGRQTIIGYRGNLAWYMGEAIFGGVGRFRIRPAREFFTENLLRGVPGTMRNDAVFPRMWGQQAAIYVQHDAVEAELFAERLRAAQYGGDYRYSPPRADAPPGSTEARMYERLRAPGRPEAVFCTNNCINVPVPEIQASIGGTPSLTLPDGTVLDLTTGSVSGGAPDPTRAGRARDMQTYADEGVLPAGARRIVYTPRAATATGVVRAGGGLMLIYGVYQTSSRLSENYGTPHFRRTVGEEAGAWSFGFLGSALSAGAATAGAAALSGALGGGVLCAPGGPVDLACVAIGAAGGLIGGFVFGTAGALLGGELAAAPPPPGGSPATRADLIEFNEAWRNAPARRPPVCTSGMCHAAPPGAGLDGFQGFPRFEPDRLREFVESMEHEGAAR